MDKAFIFDMDGVLFDTERMCLDSWKPIAEKYNISNFDEVFARCIGTNESATRQICLDYYGPDFPYDEYAREAGLIFHQMIDENGPVLKPGVKELLEFLKTQNYKIGLASSTKKASVEKYLKQAGIREYFQVLATGDMIVHSKPDPEIYLLACEKLGVKPENAYAVEDSFNGVRAGVSAGIKTFMVPDMKEPDDEIRGLCFMVCRDLLVVIDMLVILDLLRN